MITDITFDFDNRITLAPGSDLWPVPCGADGHLYTAWGDGGSFGGTNSDGRASLGFARIEGSPDSFVGMNVWGGKDVQSPATFTGKSAGILSVDGVLYAWINTQAGDPPDFRLATSRDRAATWQMESWVFPSTDFVPSTV